MKGKVYQGSNIYSLNIHVYLYCVTKLEYVVCIMIPNYAKKV